ncbi:MAG TPA: hypothetical protein VFH44_06510 [Solirubrobacterales bacterium]|nr:hypothetical protein [Solirubrobacterales bacterium]
MDALTGGSAIRAATHAESVGADDERAAAELRHDPRKLNKRTEQEDANACS